MSAPEGVAGAGAADANAKPSSASKGDSYPSEWKPSMKSALETKSTTTPRRTQSESSMELSQSSLLSVKQKRRSTSEQRSGSAAALPTTDSTVGSPVASLPSSASRSISISTIGSAQLSSDNVTLISDSDTSSYTTESSYQLSANSSYTLGSGSSGSLPERYVMPASNFLREIHVGVDVTATPQQIQLIRSDLRGLLANEISLVGQAGGGRPAIYLIAYHYM